MATYDLEEQEQIAQLKGFWTQYGNLIVIAISVALLVVAAWRFWGWYQVSQSAQAAAIYSELQKAAGANDAKKVRELGGALLESHGGTLYASLGALISAKVHFAAGDLKTARVQLQWVVDKARDPEIRAVARLRLASVLLDEKAYDDALKVLAEKPPGSFEALFEDARGDVLLAQGKAAEARAAYQAALAKLGAGDDAARELVQLKLDGAGAR
ncbi:MAG TPA: tetratricopeptide repeat protein [Burkholderiales bacterium]|jgi:predicted negative regulator of RcsB-dependent stress response|nr:tetratricopeptide repeat protein [Burkholderiales bacterium]